MQFITIMLPDVVRECIFNYSLTELRQMHVVLCQCQFMHTADENCPGSTIVVCVLPACFICRVRNTH